MIRFRHAAQTHRKPTSGFTLVEMLVVAPIVILSIGAFIAAIVNLTGEVMSSRGSNTLIYDVQDALNRIEQDVKLSTGFLATTSIDMTSANQQGYSPARDASTTPFVNVGSAAGPVLILNSLVTTGQPASISSRNVYLDNQPNSCGNTGDDFAVYSKNRPMTMNVVYFIDGDNTLWRRTVFPADYASNGSGGDGSGNCGTPWQQPTCNMAVVSFCTTNDEKLVEGVSPESFSLQYFTNSSSTSPIVDASNTAKNDAERQSALQPATTLLASIIATKTIAGRDITQSGTMRVTRLDTNATSVAVPALPNTAPAIPVVSGVVSNGHTVIFSWPRVANASAYDLRYRINGGVWIAANDLANDSRSYTVTSGGHGDTVDAQVLAKTTCTTGACASAYSASTSINIPIWAPLLLQNGWTRYHPTYASAGYTKTSAGVVMLKGLIKSGSYDTVTAQLPPDYRPAAHLMFNTSGNSAACRVDVYSTGTVSVTSACNNAWTGLDGINFMASGTSFTNMTFATTPTPNWVNFTTVNPGSGWASASYAVDSLGRVHTNGLVASGVSTSGTVMTLYPSALSPPGTTLVTDINSNAMSYIGLSTAGEITARGGSNSYVSLQSMFWPATARGTNNADCTQGWCDLTLKAGTGWVYYGSPYSTPQYTKSADGIVQVKGLIKGGASGTVVANLSNGYCPKERLLIGTVGSASTWARIDVITPSPDTGTGCQLYAYTANTTWTSLDSVIYRAEQ